MKSVFLLLALLAVPASAQDLVLPNISVVPQDKSYLTQDVRNTRIIYTQDNKEHAQYAAGFETLLQPLYEKTFGYQMDTQLSVGLMSSHNQIANGFSTQFPSNRQVNYMGGAQIPDYFSSSSWLDTLLLHETAHNFQTNVKDNPISKGMYSVFRNGGFLLPFFPATSPNIFESSFILEGNAVLNESWHGRGGRLYSGRYRAMNYIFAKAGYLTKARLYNQTMNFPYGESHYVFGSHYQYYLAKTYGLDATNAYFKYRSKNWYFPFMVNAPTRHTFGVNFDTSFAAWVNEIEAESQSIKLVEGEILARSKFYSDMNTQDGKVLFLAMEKGVRAPELFQYHKQQKTLSYDSRTLALGRVFLVDNEYYTISGRHTSPWRIRQGLFDESAMIKNGTEGKIIQGFLSDGRAVYFDSKTSFVSPQLYVDGEFYAQVHSSVLVHDDHLYYFVQKGDQRTLYRDKVPLYSLKGFYSIVADVDENGSVYFIANSKMGSSLYKINNGQVTRVLDADNIVAAKLADEGRIIVQAISADDYYYAMSEMETINESPYVVRYLWDDENNPSHGLTNTFDEIPAVSFDDPEEYGFFNNADYTMGSFIAGKNTNGDSTYDLSIVFSDPLAYHSLAFKAQKDADQSTLLGGRYSNNQYFLLFGIDAFYVAKNGLEEYAHLIETRDYGVAADLKLPFLRTGYWAGQLKANYYQDYIDIDREPLSVSMNISRAQAFGNSFYYNSLAYLDVFNTQDRSDTINGASFRLSTDLPAEFYIGVSGKYSQSDHGASARERRGVELENSISLVGNDPSGFLIPSLVDDVYAKEVTFGEVNVSKVFNLSAYFFTFPLSLQRESISLAYRHYDIQGVSGLGVNDGVKINQAAVKLSFDTTLMNNYVVRFAIEATHNDDDTITDSDLLSFGIEVPL